MLTVSSIDARDGAHDGQAGSDAFTLIELLVVIAVIALLLAVLLPALAIAKERCRRAVCQSNIHQFTLGIHVYAHENKDRLPSGFSDMGPDEHTPIIAMATHDSLVASIDDERPMRCPWLKEPFTGTNNWYYNKYANYGYLMGYNYLGGHGGTPWPLLGPANAEWISPQLSTEAGRLLIVTELNAWTASENVTFAPHGKRGPILDYSNPGPGGGIPSEQVGAEGGNIGLLDGSVSWKKMRDMKIYRGSRMQGPGGLFTAW